MQIFIRLDKHPDRPMFVTYAVYLLYAYLGISLLLYLVNIILFFFDPPPEFPWGTFLFNFVLTLLIYLTMFWVAIKVAAGRNWARWLLIIGYVFILIGTTCNAGLILAGDALSGIQIVGQVVVTAMAAVLLFQRESNQWFTGTEAEQ